MNSNHCALRFTVPKTTFWQWLTRQEPEYVIELWVGRDKETWIADARLQHVAYKNGEEV